MYVTGVGHTSLSSASIRSGEIIIPHLRKGKERRPRAAALFHVPSIPISKLCSRNSIPPAHVRSIHSLPYDVVPRCSMIALSPARPTHLRANRNAARPHEQTVPGGAQPHTYILQLQASTTTPRTILRTASASIHVRTRASPAFWRSAHSTSHRQACRGSPRYSRSRCSLALLGSTQGSGSWAAVHSGRSRAMKPLP